MSPPPLLLIALAVAILGGLHLLSRWIVRSSGRAVRRLPAAPFARSLRRRALALERAARRRAPGPTAFLMARISVGSFLGLPLTAILCTLGILTLLFGELAEEVVENEELVALDRSLLQALRPLRSDTMVGLFAWITDLASNTSLVVAVVVAVGLLAAYRRHDLLIGLAITVLGSQSMLWLAKLGFARERPAFLTDVVAASPSFPSGHATGAMAIYGFLAYALMRLVRRSETRFEIAFWTAVLVLLVGFSRLLLHVHYPSDVLAGLVTGALWLLVGVACAEWWRGRRATR